MEFKLQTEVTVLMVH